METRVVNGDSLVTVVQARCGSTRLPRKVLLPLGGATVLERMLERVAHATRRGPLVVATTTAPEDDEIEALCARVRVCCYRGDPDDLLDRHYQVARALGAAHVVKIPSDCPLIDPDIIDRVISAYLDPPPLREGWDYVSNLHPASYPDGNDVEICSFAALESAWRLATRSFEREHTTPFLWERPEVYRIGNVAWEIALDLSKSHRVVLDYVEDYEVIRRVFDALFPENPWFGVRDVVRYLNEHPDVAALNERHRGVNWYRHHLAELRTVTAADTRAEAHEVPL